MRVAPSDALKPHGYKVHVHIPQWKGDYRSSLAVCSRLTFRARLRNARSGTFSDFPMLLDKLLVKMKIFGKFWRFDYALVSSAVYSSPFFFQSFSPFLFFQPSAYLKNLIYTMLHRYSFIITSYKTWSIVIIKILTATSLS